MESELIVFVWICVLSFVGLILRFEGSAVQGIVGPQ